MSTLPSVNELAYFLEISGTLNLSRAAERLGVTQPALSLAMAKLERGLGAQLLVRGRSGVRLTPVGAKFAQEARTLIEQWERLRAEAIRDENEVRGRVILGCHASVALFSLELFMPVMLNRYPRLEIRLLHDLSRKVTEGIISHQVDIGIVVNPVKHPDLVIHRLWSDRVGFWHRKGLDPRQTDVLICDPSLMQTQTLLKKLKKSGWDFKRVLESSSLEVVRGLVGSGSGIGILPGKVASQDSRLVLIEAADAPTFEDSICLVYRADLPKSRSFRVVIDAIRASFRGPVSRESAAATIA